MTQGLSFALEAALTGIGIVFGFLLLLSLLMVAIRGLADGLSGGTGSSAASTPATGTASVEAVAAEQPALPPWVVAAAAAYLEREADAEQTQTLASVWVERSSR